MRIESKGVPSAVVQPITRDLAVVIDAIRIDQNPAAIRLKQRIEVDHP